MANRSRDWKESLALELKKDKKYRQAFFLALIDEGYSWREALDKIIKLIGVKECAEMIGDMRPSNLLNQIKEENDMRFTTLEKFANLVGCSVGLVPQKKAS